LLVVPSKDGACDSCLFSPRSVHSLVKTSLGHSLCATCNGYRHNGVPPQLLHGKSAEHLRGMLCVLQSIPCSASNNRNWLVDRLERGENVLRAAVDEGRPGRSYKVAAADAGAAALPGAPAAGQRVPHLPPLSRLSPLLRLQSLARLTPPSGDRPATFSPSVGSPAAAAAAAGAAAKAALGLATAGDAAAAAFAAAPRMGVAAASVAAAAVDAGSVGPAAPAPSVVVQSALQPDSASGGAPVASALDALRMYGDTLSDEECPDGFPLRGADDAVVAVTTLICVRHGDECGNFQLMDSSLPAFIPS
jgi:hypothetical protein